MKSHVKVANLLHMIYKILSNEINLFLFYFLVKEAGSWPLWNNSSSGSHHEPAPPSPPSDGGGPSHEIGTWNSSMIFHHFLKVVIKAVGSSGLDWFIILPEFQDGRQWLGYRQRNHHQYIPYAKTRVAATGFHASEGISIRHIVKLKTFPDSASNKL